MGRFHHTTDWAYGFIYNDATNTGGRDAYIQAVTLVGPTGTPGGTGSASLNTGQVADSLSPAAAIQIVAARAGRASVTLTNITGTQPVYYGNTGVTTGTGVFVAGAAGASITLYTSAAIFATSPTAAQTISFVESF